MRIKFQFCSFEPVGYDQFSLDYINWCSKTCNEYRIHTGPNSSSFKYLHNVSIFIFLRFRIANPARLFSILYEILYGILRKIKRLSVYCSPIFFCSLGIHHFFNFESTLNQVIICFVLSFYCLVSRFSLKYFLYLIIKIVVLCKFP